MDKKEFRQLFEYYRKALRLDYCDIKYSFEDLEDIVWLATPQFSYVRWHIVFANNLLEDTTKEIKHTIVHELLHMYTWFYKDDVLRLEMTENEKTLFINSIRDKEESIIENLTRILLHNWL